jgi:hypothetical protein
LSLNLTDADLPPLFRAADQSSLEAQRWFLNATKVRLMGLIGAAFFGLFVWTWGQSPVDWAGVLAALCFGIALVVEGYLLKSKPERTWYDGRAVAESMKTLTWRYAMGADPFNIEHAAAEADELFVRQLGDVLGVVKDLDLAPDAAVGEQITAAMRAVRAASLQDRKAIYAEHRVDEQQSWYSRKAKWNRSRANRWALGMLAIEVLGIGAGILKAIGTIHGDLLGFGGAIAAAMTAWLQTKQHRSLAAAYTVTALELASVRSRIRHQESEGNWAAFVSDAEDAFSREHTLWKASRGVRSI